MPFTLYSRLVPVGPVITIVPVGVGQIGCAVTLAVGAEGGVGTAFTVSTVAVDTHPVIVFLTVTL